MILKSTPNKLTFIVDTLCSIGYEHKGASLVLHKLAYELASYGHYVYTFNNPLFPHPNIEVIPVEKKNKDEKGIHNFHFTQCGYNLSRTISIYTQITWGNPMNTIHNVRYVLHDYEPAVWDSFSNDEYVCNFGTFKVPEGTKQNKLTVLDYKFDKFYNTNNPNRKGFAHIIHKNTPKWGLDFLQQFGSYRIPYFNGDGDKSLDHLLDEFNKYEYVMTFDDKSYLTTAAALCGAKSIILNPDKKLSPLEYRENNPLQMCGVAYGFDDIKWANNTIGFVRDNLLQLEQKDKQTILNFIEYWENKLL
jgi:hypothetical protein